MIEQLANRVQPRGDYGKEFHSIFASMVRGALASDELVMVSELFALYPDGEIISAANAARDAGLPVDEGVGYFLLCVCACEARTSNEDLSRETALRYFSGPARTDSRLSTIIDYAIPILLGEKGTNQELVDRFIRGYVGQA